MINANGLKITAKYNSATNNDNLHIGATLYGIDDNGNAQWWNWGENPNCIWPSGNANTEVTKELKYTEKLYESNGGEWISHANGISYLQKDYPTGSENAHLREI